MATAHLRVDVDHLKQGARAGLARADDDGARQSAAGVREVEAAGAGARAHHRAGRGVAEPVQEHGGDKQQQQDGGDQQPAAAPARRLQPGHHRRPASVTSGRHLLPRRAVEPDRH